MNVETFKNRIVALLEDATDTPMTAAEIAGALAWRAKERKRLQKWLADLSVEGRIVRIKHNRYAIGAPADLFAGDFEMTRFGRGFVVLPDGARVDVREGDSGVALPGDRVVVRLVDEPAHPHRGARGRRSEEPAARAAKVIRILERRRHDVVGTLRTTGNFWYVEPLTPAYRKDFYVRDPAQAREGDRVLVRFTDWPHKHVNPEADIIERLGPAEEPSTDTLAVIRHYGLRDAFSDEVMREAEQASAAADEAGERLDLRDRLVFTIDPVRARDFDDALSLEPAGDGRRVLGIHIADVSHFVRPGGALDREAAERGNSVYLVDRVLPMLPEQLSNGICSLRPDQDRLAFSVLLTVNDEGDIVERRFARSLIRSCCRLTYAQALAMLETGRVPRDVAAPRAGEVVPLLREIGGIARAFRERRMAAHALDMDMPECEIALGADGRVREVATVMSDDAHRLVEECMVAANEAVAMELSRRGRPYISRLHEPPFEQSVEQLKAELVLMGFRPGDLAKPANLSRFLKRLDSHPLRYHARMAVLKSMKRAVYSAAAEGHFGLAKRFYAHFTSPIRRYPDLVVHRQLAAALASPPATVYEKGALTIVAGNCSQTEQAAEEAERDLLEMKKYRYLADQLREGKPQVYRAVVVSVMNFGLFVLVNDLQIQGLVHVSALSSRFVRYSRRDRTLRAGREVFGLGRELNVRVSKVDFAARKIDFVPAQADGE